MKVIVPITLTDSILTASNVAENDHGIWDVGTNYNAGDYVISTATHRVFLSVAGANLGNDPDADDGTNWTFIGATNRWKAFDKTISDMVVNAGSVTYLITPETMVTGIAFLGLDASEVRVQIAAAGYDETISLVDDAEVVDWFTFFTWDAEGYDT